MRILLILLLVAGLIFGGFFFFMRTQDNDMKCAEKNPHIVAFGDSLVVGYGAPKGQDAFSILATKLDVSIENKGVNGDSTVTALQRIDRVLDGKPDIVVVLLGGNDALQRIPVSETEENLSEILKRLTDAGIRPILVGVIGGYPTDPYAVMFERLSDEYEVPLVPDILAGLIGREEFMSDAIHPNAAGYARIADRLEPVIESVCASS